MHDPVDIRRRIERLIERVNRRDDYGQLLASGQVVHSADEVMDVDAWRAEIRRQARADKIKVRTGFNDGLVWALRRRPDRATSVRDIQRYRDLLAHAVPLAVDLGHEPTLTLWDGEAVEVDGRRTRLARGAATLLSSHAGHPRPATSDTTKGSQARRADSLKESQLAAGRDLPSAPDITDAGITTASLEGGAPPQGSTTMGAPTSGLDDDHLLAAPVSLVGVGERARGVWKCVDPVDDRR